MRAMTAGGKALTDSLSELAITLTRSPTIADVLRALAEQIVAVEGVDSASASLQEAGRWRLYAASDERSRVLERSQKRSLHGPSVEAFRGGTIVALRDIREAPQEWAAFRSAAGATGIVSAASVPLLSADAHIGAVSLYSTRRRYWSRVDFDAARVLGDLVTSYVVTDVKLATQEAIIRQLREALSSRVVIEQAKGVLAAERGVPVGEAFEMLRRSARNQGVTLRTVAAAVVDSRFRP
jgi:hypothetical protein